MTADLAYKIAERLQAIKLIDGPMNSFIVLMLALTVFILFCFLLSKLLRLYKRNK